MIKIDIKTRSGASVSHGVLMIFAVNGQNYAATVPLHEDDTPCAADVSVFGCQILDDGQSFQLYELCNKEDYSKAAMAFSKLQAQL